MGGDRECPNCLQETLIECSGARWKCLNCGEVYDDEDLDKDIEVEDEE